MFHQLIHLWWNDQKKQHDSAHDCEGKREPRGSLDSYVLCSLKTRKKQMFLSLQIWFGLKVVLMTNTAESFRVFYAKYKYSGTAFSNFEWEQT